MAEFIKTITSIFKLTFLAGVGIYAILEYILKGIGFLGYLGTIFFVVFSSYKANEEETKLLKEYYNSWFFTYFITSRLYELNNANTSSRLSEQYYKSKNEIDFVQRVGHSSFGNNLIRL